VFIAKDINHFKSLFVNQLRKMLSNDELGAFILVLANSLQDEFLKAELAEELRNNFLSLRKSFIKGSLNAAKDDLDVFEKLLALDLSDLPVWQCKTMGDWEISFNTLRQLRPVRASAQKFSSIKQDFDDNRFHFNKPFLDPEILWQGTHRGVTLKVLYNKFPFADYHLLVVVSPEENSAQLLTREKHDYAFSLVTDAAAALTGFGIGYNSLAAGASVNHIHFQGFVRLQDFPIEKSHWLHNGGDKDYPLAVSYFSDAESSWIYLDKLTGRDIAFNILYRENGCYVVPRKYQNSTELPDWLAGAGWTDVAGVITLSDEATFNAIDQQSISNSLTLLSEKGI
jgi:diadenosine tetraphosphate (Ap4A) HIT family hydrolase